MHRSVPRSLAPVLTELELERPAVVTLDWLEQTRSRLRLPLNPTELARRLRRLGWLLPLRVRGAWEFAPADRAGPLPGGDPFIEVRALNAVRPHLKVGVGYESAAFLRSLASRQPAREVLVCDEGIPTIRALDGFRRVDLSLPSEAYSDLTGLRVQTPAGLLAAVAIRPNGIRDWPGLSEWLGTAANQADPRLLTRLLADRPAAAWARAAYLLHVGGNKDGSSFMHERRPGGHGPFYLGPRRQGGHYDRDSDIVDSVVARYTEAGQGP